ncbi:MAG: amidase family protein [Myxococcota bacterium]
MGLRALASALATTPGSASRLLKERAERRREAWGAYRVFEPERAVARRVDQGAFRGQPLAGLPVSVKDLFGVSGFDVWAGSKRELPARFEAEGPLISALRRQGAPIMGKTHTVEFAFGGIGTNGHWNTPENPRVPGHVPGGSSSGAPASLVEGSAAFALGSDTAGSVRIPASFSGVVGFKPSNGRWSRAGIVPLSPTLDTAGLLTLSVDDADFVVRGLEGAPIRGGDRSIAGLRLGRLSRHVWEDADPAVVDSVDAALARLASAGAKVVDAKVPETGAALGLFRKGSVTAAECHAFLATELPRWLFELEPKVRSRVLAGAQLSAVEYLRRRGRIERLRKRVRERALDGTIWVAPTTAQTAPRREDVESPEDYGRLNLLALRNTSIANTLGWCALSLPCGADGEGRPIGLMMMAPAGRDLELLAAGRAVERVLGAADQVF